MNRKPPSGIFRRLTSLIGRSGETSDMPSERGPRVDLLRQRVAEKANDAPRVSTPSRTGHAAGAAPALEPPNLLLPVRRGSETIDRAMPVELREGPEEFVMGLIEAETAHTEGILPYRLDELTRTLCVAVAAPLTTKREQALKALVRPRLGFAPNISTYVTSAETLSRLIRRHYDDHSRAGLDQSSMAVERIATPRDERERVSTTVEGDGETRAFVLNLLVYAINQKARDVMISPHKARTVLSIITERGKQEVPLPRDLPRASAAYLSRIVKQMCEPKLDVLETRRPQKGTLALTIETPNGPVELSARVNVTPKAFGELIDMRLFSDDLELDFDSLVTCEFSRHWIEWAVAERQGILFFASPPGSGKSTLQHAILRPPLVPSRLNVLSIEHPIERYNPHIEQCPVTDHVSQDELLDQHLQNSPDAMMIGEVTRESTARLLFKASRASIQMFSTLHAFSAARAIERLLDLGVTRREIAEDVRVLVAQRLLDRACRDCLEPIDVPHEALIYAQMHASEVDDFEPMESRGCDVCDGEGVVGKIAIIETIPVLPDVKQIILDASPESLVDDVTLAAIRLGMTPLRRHAIEHYKRHEIPYRELARVERLTPEQLVSWWNLNRREPFRLVRAEPSE